MPYITYTAGYKYQLAKDYEYVLGTMLEEPVSIEFVNLSKSGVLRIKKGYAWDGPSGMTIDTRTFMRGSLVHDALYQLMRLDRLDHEKWKEFADYTLWHICRQDDMNRMRAWTVYWGVKLFGDPFVHPSHNRPLLYAP